jgi:hypothetical protein
VRSKRHDSVNPIIAETPPYSQQLDGRFALRHISCGFFVASFAVGG